MALNISSKNNKPTRVKVVSADTTKVKKVVVGRPVRRVTASQGTIGGLDDVDNSNAQDGSVLVYNGSSSKYEATLVLEKQTINGGHY